MTTPPQDWKEYQAIKEFYGDRRANRSQAPLINHIEEGLTVLRNIGASEAAMRAYCLHPLFQMDDDLKRNADFARNQDPYVLMLAMEYRSVANEYLSHRQIKGISEIRLSPLPEVNQMLVADKMQNFKDFMIHHYGTHARSKELHQYFKNWFEKLGIPQGVFESLEQRAAHKKSPDNLKHPKI